MAAMDGRFSVSLDDIRKVAVPVLRHRISTNFQAQAEGQTTESLIKRLVAEIREPDLPKYERRGTRLIARNLISKEARRWRPTDRSSSLASKTTAGSSPLRSSPRPTFDEPWRYEREDGRLIVMSPDSKQHDDCSEPFRDHLGAYKLARPDLVEQVISEAWVRVHGGTDRIPDIAVFLVGDRPDPPRPDRVPAIIFEIVSPDKESRDRDYIEKRAEYHRLGVREYVIIDRFQQIVTVLSYAPIGYDERILNVDDTYESPLLPGLMIPLTEVL